MAGRLGRIVAWAALILGVSVLAAIVINNVYQSVQRDRQRKTMADIFAMSVTLEAYAVDYKHYPEAQNIDELAAALEPVYIKKFPRVDGWGHPIEVHRIPASRTGLEGFVIRSPGRDGIYEYTDLLAYHEGPVVGYDRDIVYSTVGRSQWPEGFMGF